MLIAESRDQLSHYRGEKVVVGDGHLFFYQQVLRVAKGSCCSQTT